MTGGILEAVPIWGKIKIAYISYVVRITAILIIAYKEEFKNYA